MNYYLDEDGGLWKKENSDDYYFSRKTLDWIRGR